MNELLDRVQAAVGDAYRIESELPAGGMSRIFLATESSLSRRVVVKVLPPEMTSEVSTARFRQEMELLARLQHPHILPILTTGSRADVLYYVMPYVAGESLRHRLVERGKLDVEEALRILAEMADALGYAHSAGVLHRDIKPENILLEGRHAILADFGIARALADAKAGERLTATGASVGTPGYMSPEQMSGDAIDVRAEIYALAVVGYEMLTGKPPFEGPTAQAVITAHLTTPPLPVGELRPEVPPHVSRAIAKALSKVPGERFANFADFAVALGAAVPAGVAGSDGGRRQRPRGVLVGAALAVAVAAMAWGGVRARGAAMPAAALDSLRVAVDSGRIDAVAQLLEASSLPVTHRSVRALTSGLTGSLAVRSDPPGAEIWIERATPLATFADRSFRRITSEPTELVAGEYAVRLTGGAGADTLYRLARVTAGATTAFVAEWPVRDSIQGAFQRISAGRSPVDGVGIEGFLIAEREVTNAQFQRFVSAGGYRNVALWSPTMLVDGRSVPATEAIGRFVDRTGLLGPRDWESGRFPAAKGDHPVTGVSWYEADAYARWAGAALPSASQFWRAAQGDSLTIYPWGEDAAGAQYRANLEGVDTAPVGGSPLGVSRFGVMDLAGNVREWLTDTAAATSRRVTVGGSWQDPFYMADPVKAESFAPSYANRAIGFRVVRTLAPQPRN